MKKTLLIVSQDKKLRREFLLPGNADLYESFSNLHQSYFNKPVDQNTIQQLSGSGTELIILEVDQYIMTRISFAIESAPRSFEPFERVIIKRSDEDSIILSSGLGLTIEEGKLSIKQ